MGCFNSCPTRRRAIGTYDYDINSSCVYVKFIENGAYQIFYLYDLHSQELRRCPRLPQGLLNSATAVLARRLYVIGGTDDKGNPSRNVYVFDLENFEWKQSVSLHTTRERAVAAVANGRIYVFGGCGGHHPQPHVRWAEVYDPSGFKWTEIQKPSSYSLLCLSADPLHAVVFRENIFITNSSSGMAYNVTSLAWEGIPRLLYDFWFRWETSAVEVEQMFVAYHNSRNTKDLKAYDPEQALWLPLHYQNPAAFPINIRTNRFNIFSLKGQLVGAVHMGGPLDPLQFAQMSMRMDYTRPEQPVRVYIENTFTYPSQSKYLELEWPVLAMNP